MKIGDGRPAIDGARVAAARMRARSVGHSTGVQRLLLDVELLEIVGSAAPQQIHRANQSRHVRRRLPSFVRVCERRRRIGIEAIAVDVKGDVGARQLGIEFLRELRGARTQRGAHPIALRLADFAEPAVLEGGERGEEHEQKDGGGQLPGKPAHASTLPRRNGGRRRLYISYKTIAQR
jgi:hypothetical protein